MGTPSPGKPCGGADRRAAPHRVAASDREKEVARGMLELLALSGAAATILWAVAGILIVAGIVVLIRGEKLVGVALVIVGLLVAPVGVSIFK